MTPRIDLVMPCRNAPNVVSLTPADLAANDEPIRALALARATGDLAAVPELERRLGHLASREVYAAFYNEPSPQRPWMPLEQVRQCHQTMPRWGMIWQQLILHNQQDILELGCMDGFCALNLALHGRSVHGVDVNRAAIVEATQRARHFNVSALVTFDAGLIEDVDLGPRFDAVLAMEVLEHVHDVDAVLAVAERHLRPGGRVYVSFPLTAPKHTHEREAREHVRLFTYDAAMDLLLAPARRCVFYTQLPTPDGLHHCGAYELREVP